MKRALAVCFLLSTAAAAEDSLHLALLGGGGVAYGVVGVHAEPIIGDHFAPFFGVGADLYVGEAPCFAAGLRWFSGQRAGFVISAQIAWLDTTHTGNPSSEFAHYQDVYLGVTVGGRYRHPKGFIVDLGIGLGHLRSRQNGNALPAVDCGPSGAVSGSYSCEKSVFFPDVDVAIGWDF